MTALTPEEVVRQAAERGERISRLQVAADIRSLGTRLRDLARDLEKAEAVEVPAGSADWPVLEALESAATEIQGIRFRLTLLANPLCEPACEEVCC